MTCWALPCTTHDGMRLGRVADARFVVDGAPHQLMADARLLGLVVSPHSWSSFLGYERNSLTQPWPLAQLLRWRHRGSFLVLWEDIATIGTDIRPAPGRVHPVQPGPEQQGRRITVGPVSSCVSKVPVTL